MSKKRIKMIILLPDIDKLVISKTIKIENKLTKVFLYFTVRK